MEVVKANGVPIYELTCTECQSIIRYKASEVSAYHITCPVCGVSNWATTSCPVDVETSKIYYYADDVVHCEIDYITTSKTEET